MMAPKGAIILLKLLYHALVGGIGFLIVGGVAAAVHFGESWGAQNNALSPESLLLTRGLADFIYLCDSVGIAALVVWELLDLIKSITTA
jgi:hypothetical protein